MTEDIKLNFKRPGGVDDKIGKTNNGMASCDETAAEELGIHQPGGGRGEEQHVKYHGAGCMDDLNNRKAKYAKAKYAKANGGPGGVGRRKSEKTAAETVAEKAATEARTTSTTAWGRPTVSGTAWITSKRATTRSCVTGTVFRTST